jgi:D-glycero-D-manno-heptose 1,7-bisphosphate phosphatase
MSSNFLNIIDPSWTLFLDRDGVINVEKENDYIRHVAEFHFLEGVELAIATLSQVFGRIVVVTNQKGIGKGLMTETDLSDIHQKMTSDIAKAGGRIDQVYFCPDINPDSSCRKPNTGMALQAKMDFKEIEFTRSVMVGNTISDMQFGRSCGMRTIFVLSAKPVPELPHPAIDEIYPSLAAFANRF